MLVRQRVPTTSIDVGGDTRPNLGCHSVPGFEESL